MRFSRTSDDPMDPKWRLAVEDEDGAGIITIAEEDISSNSITARTTGIRSAIDLDSDQARWLHFALGQLLLRRENYDPFARHGVTDEEANAVADAIKRDTNEMSRRVSQMLTPELCEEREALQVSTVTNGEGPER